MGRPPKSREQNIEVLEAPPRRDMAYIPEELTDFFAAIGQRVSLASSDTNVVSRMSQNERYPIRLKDLGEEQERFVDILTGRFGFHVRGENLAKGDCYLYTQSFAAYEDQLAEGQEINAQQFGEAGFNQSLGAIDDLLRRHTDGKGSVTPRYKETRTASPNAPLG